MNSISGLILVQFAITGTTAWAMKKAPTFFSVRSNSGKTSIGPVVETTKGHIEGIKVDGINVFLGIPFAAPPVGKLRFQPPKNASKWDGTLKTRKFQNACMQSGILAATSPVNLSEDCLYLNVFTPTLTKSLPVIIFIHGGNFLNGSAAQYPVDGIVENLAKRGVVIVTINYRLNAFGFFTTNSSAVPANLALLDQIKALEWIGNEISGFGGNQNNVTVYGESAGAACVSILTYSPKARGLFQKAIISSGTAHSPWALDGAMGYLTNSSKQLAISSKCITESEWNSKNFKNLSSCLQKLTANALMHMAEKLSWLPSVDGNSGILPDWPENLASQRDPNMPIILGTNKDEVALPWILELLFAPFASFGISNGINVTVFNKETFENQLKYTVSQWHFGQQTPKIRELLRYIYLDSRKEPISNHDYLEWFHVIVQMTSGYTMFAPTSKEANILRRSNNPNVYLYSFDYISDGFPFKPKEFKAAMHGMDIFLTFKNMWQKAAGMWIPWNYTERDLSVSNKLGEMWTNFAKTGKPSKTWKPFSISEDQVYPVALSINVETKIQNSYEPLAVNLWNSLIPTLLNNTTMYKH